MLIMMIMFFLILIGVVGIITIIKTACEKANEVYNSQPREPLKKKDSTV